MTNKFHGLTGTTAPNISFNRPFSLVDFGFPNTDHVTVPRRFELLLCSLKRPRTSMKMSNFERKHSPEYRHMICIGQTTSTSEKGLLTLQTFARSDIYENVQTNWFVNISRRFYRLKHYNSTSIVQNNMSVKQSSHQ